MIQQNNRAAKTPVVIVISTVLLISGLHELFSPPGGFFKHIELISIQLPLIRLKTPSVAHVAITLLVPLLSIVAAAMLLLNRKAGWWVATVICSFSGFLYLLGFMRGAYVPALLRGYFGSMPAVDIELLVRGTVFLASFVYLLQSSVWSLYFERVLNLRATALSILLGNVAFAL